MGQEILHNPCHIPTGRSQLIRNLSALYLDIREEITTAFDNVLDLRDDGGHLVLIPVHYS